MKTLLCYNDPYEGAPIYIDLPGDFTKFRGLYIGTSGNDPDLEQELLSILDKRSNYPHLKEPTKDWTHFVNCGSNY